MNKEEIELLASAKLGNAMAIDNLLNNYKWLVSSIARKYYLMGGEQEDLTQEGMIGLFRAITTFDIERGVVFETFAGKLIERSIIDAVKRDNSHSQQFLSDSIFVDNDDTLVASDMSPEGSFISRESTLELTAEIDNKLSPLERDVVKYYLKGYNYKDIGKKLGKTSKAIDNTLTRIKKKLGYLKERL